MQGIREERLRCKGKDRLDENWPEGWACGGSVKEYVKHVFGEGRKCGDATWRKRGKSAWNLEPDFVGLAFKLKVFEFQVREKRGIRDFK